MMPKQATQPKQKASSLAASVYQRLYAHITDGVLAPGTKLLPAELSAEYDVGLTPLRDALNRLCADGLAVKQEQRGFFVAAIDEAAFLEITNARLVVEEAALRLSIASGVERWEEGIVLTFHRLTKVGTLGKQFVLTPEWSQAHQEFHFSLLAACGNEWLLGFCRKLYEQTTRYRARRRLISAGNASPGAKNIVKAHRSIMEATLARDAERAAQLLVEHYRSSFELVMGAKYQLLSNPHRLMPIVGGAPDQAKPNKLSPVGL